MLLNNFIGHGQPNARAAHRSVRFKKLFLYAVNILLRNSNPGVGDLNIKAALLLVHLYQHMAAGSGIFNGVINNICKLFAFLEHN